MASSISISSNYPCFSSRSGLLTTLRDPRRPALSAQVSAAGGKKRYKGTVKREEALSEMIEKKVAEAIETCEGDEGQKESEGCRVAWDEVEEVSQAKADLRRRMTDSGGADPLESFCQGNPDSDECVVYDD
ncbi:Calvin cycle protein CP12-3 [Carex littledalei]|uniref:Calvin cycle protein CP12-3 n=1 Tax=Carex littledalei TaxID=544730 RepID=A0A833VQJ2_9POAL|nr:Calvin cycle protein CP12-3 [Carex littledalei]